MSDVLWWIANGVLLVAAVPVLREAFRIITSLKIVAAAAVDIRNALGAVKAELPSAAAALADTTVLSRRLSAAVKH